MDTYPLLVLANEPAAYRSLLASELPFLRPNLQVLAIDPADLEETVTRLHPAAVICSRACDTVRDPAVDILVLEVEDEVIVLRLRDGTDRVMANPRLADILEAIDQALPVGSA